MRVLSAFFADHVAIYDNRLNVLGGVWTHLTLQAIPQDLVLPLAVIAQLAPEDAGQLRTLVVTVTVPGQDESGVVRMPWQLAEQPGEYFCWALPLSVTARQPGRLVVMLDIDDETESATSVALDLRFDTAAPAFL